MIHLEGVREAVGSGPGVVLWRYAEPGGGPGITPGNPFAELAAAHTGVLYRRCYNLVRPPGFRFPLAAFLKALSKLPERTGVVIFHDPECATDFLDALPDIAKACLGHQTRLVLVSEWGRFLDRCAEALDPLTETIPVERVAASGSGQRFAG
jgi:hypothetical protein